MQLIFLLLLMASIFGMEPIVDYCKMLEQEVQGLQAPFLSGKKGNFYVAGASLPPSIDHKEPWPINENETIGFTHAFFRDGRARGLGIVTDELTGTGHSMWGWEFWRLVRTLYGKVEFKYPNGSSTIVSYPAPTSLKWQPDRLTVTYDILGLELIETKFFTNEDVLVDTISVKQTNKIQDVKILLHFDGHSFVDTRTLPTFDGDKPAPRSMARNSTARYDAKNNIIDLLEKGTAWAKTTYCTGTPEKYIKDCPAKVGPLMYNGMHVVLSSSSPMSAVNISLDSERRVWYYFTVALPLDGSNISITFAQDDDYSKAVSRTNAALKDPSGALIDTTASVNEFLNTEVPYFRSSDTNATIMYYYSWALYYMYILDVGVGWEKYPHAQTAVNNFLGLHAYDDRIYIPMGAWLSDLKRYAYGNVLMWTSTLPFSQKMPDVGLTGDNMGQGWVSPMNCSDVSGHPEGAWQIYLHGADKNEFLEPAYMYYLALWGPNSKGNINPIGGIAVNSLQALYNMSLELNRPQNEVEYWLTTRDNYIRYEDLHPPESYTADACHALQYFYAYWTNDSWVSDMSNYIGMKSTHGGCYANVPLLTEPVGYHDPGNAFVVSTIVTYWTIEGMFRHNATNLGKNAVKLTLDHINGMIQNYGFPVFPESWDIFMEPWGDQYYNWDGIMALILLERFAGVSYSVVNGSSFTVRDFLPETWDFVEVRVPISKQLVYVRVERLNSQTKQITVSGNPLDKLIVQPWLEGHKLKVASPEGFGLEEDRVCWTFTGSSAKSIVVKITTT